MIVKPKNRFGLALSGGGYRAAGFHLGTMRKLHELGLLNQVNVLSTISGGSITGAAYCLSNKSYEEFEKEMIELLSTKSVIKEIVTSYKFIRAALFALLCLVVSGWLLFTRYSYLAPIPFVILAYLIIAFQFKLLPISEMIEKAYDKFFFKNATLPDLCDSPKIAIGSTNLQTCKHFTFSKYRMGDSEYTYSNEKVEFTVNDFPVSKAVMASSCVPFAFTPISIEKKYFANPKQFDQIDPKLVDGGVYDNQGIHKLTFNESSYSCEIVVVSDAGNKLPFRKLYNNTFTLLLRTVDTFMMRIKNFQMMSNVFQNYTGREIAYLSIGWDLENCVDGFWRNLKDGNISPAVLIKHKILQEWIADPDKYKIQIKQHISAKCNESEILSRNLSIDRLKAIRDIGTNLTPISLHLINDMMIHSANLTEMQIRLYCPTLLN